MSLVIYISKEQAAQVKYLLEQAIQGNHVLFEASTLKKILESPLPVLEEGYAVEPHIEKLMSLKGLASQRAYLERLDERTFAGVVRTYLNIVENTLFEAKGIVH